MPDPAAIDLDGDAWVCKGYVGEEWRMRRAFAPDSGDVHGWLPARVPGSVVDDLVRAGEVPDPRQGRRSRDAEWVSARTWVYRRGFSLAATDGPVLAHLEGVDHAMTLYVNGEEVGRHVGAFDPARFDITDHVRVGSNLLAVVLDPAPDTQPHIGRTPLVRNLKSRMTYGWDFCPRLPHLGIWDHVELSLPGPVRIEDVFLRPALPPEEEDGLLHWRLELSSRLSGTIDASLEVRVHGSDSVVARYTEPVSLEAGACVHEGAVTVPGAERWWPNGAGPQPRYDVEVVVEAAGHTDRRTLTTAFRDLAWTRNEGAPDDARAYTLVVNGRRIRIHGWNWVPMDIHHGVEDHDRLDHLLGLAARAGVNLLRVWGGGLIERRSFYERCDALGLLVWQEFPLSSSIFDSHLADDPDFVAAVVEEARRIVPRRRNHPSLALWCGGNELDDADGNPTDGSDPVLKGLREVVAELDPDRAWLPTSPTGPAATCTLEALEQDPSGQHDVHGPWEHQGLLGQRDLFNRATSMLHSEFGVEGMANRETIEAWLAPTERWPADRSNPTVVHRGDFWINTPLLEDVFEPFDDLAEQVQASQLLQADGLRYALEANRRRQWRNSGSLPWQFNEPYPNVFCTSAVDHSGRPKSAYHAVATAYRDVHVHAAVPTQAWDGRDTFRAEVWVSTDRTPLTDATVEIAVVEPSGRRHALGREPVQAAPGETVEVTTVTMALAELDSQLFWLDLHLVDADGATLARTRDLATRGSDLHALRTLAVPELAATWTEPGHRLTVRNCGATVATAVRVEDARPATARGYLWSRPGDLTVLPGESVTIEVGVVGPLADVGDAIRVTAWRLPEGVAVA